MSAKSARQKSVGVHIRDKRIAQGLTQGELADHLGYDSAQFVSNWERGLANPPLGALKKLVKLLDLNVDEVVDLLLLPSAKKIRTAFGKWSKKGNL